MEILLTRLLYGLITFQNFLKINSESILFFSTSIKYRCSQEGIKSNLIDSIDRKRGVIRVNHLKGATKQ